MDAELKGPPEASLAPIPISTKWLNLEILLDVGSNWLFIVFMSSLANAHQNVKNVKKAPLSPTFYDFIILTFWNMALFLHGWPALETSIQQMLIFYHPSSYTKMSFGH